MSEFIPDDLFAFDDLGLEPDLLAEPVPDTLGVPEPAELVVETWEELVIDAPAADSVPAAPSDMALPDPFKDTAAAAGVISAATGVVAVMQGWRRKRRET